MRPTQAWEDRFKPPRSPRNRGMGWWVGNVDYFWNWFWLEGACLRKPLAGVSRVSDFGFLVGVLSDVNYRLNADLRRLGDRVAACCDTIMLNPGGFVSCRAKRTIHKSSLQGSVVDAEMVLNDFLEKFRTGIVEIGGDSR